MKIYTKTGDLGETSLLGGTRVSKSDPRIEAYGTVDELNSCIGMLASHTAHHRSVLLEVQHRLFDLGSLLALDPKSKFPIPEISEEHVGELEQEIDRMDAQLPELKNFILPGGNVASGWAQICRAVCRRAERRVVELEGHSELSVRYLNRLSDYLFVLARMLLMEAGDPEIKWQPRA